MTTLADIGWEYPIEWQEGVEWGVTDSKRQAICDAMEVLLKTILRANGYNVDLGSNVYSWRDANLPSANLPALIYRDEQNTVAQTFGNQIHSLGVALEIYAETNVEGMRAMIADVTKCIGTDLTLGGLCADITPLADESIRIEHANKRVFGILLKIVIQYETENWNPYD